MWPSLSSLLARLASTGQVNQKSVGKGSPEEVGWFSITVGIPR